MISVGHHRNILSARDNLLIEVEKSDTFNNDDKDTKNVFICVSRILLIAKHAVFTGVRLSQRRTTNLYKRYCNKILPF